MGTKKKKKTTFDYFKEEYQMLQIKLEKELKKYVRLFHSHENEYCQNLNDLFHSNFDSKYNKLVRIPTSYHTCKNDLQ